MGLQAQLARLSTPPPVVLNGTYDPVALKMQTYFPAASASGMDCRVSWSGERWARRRTDLPHENNFAFNGTSPNLSTWYTAKADYNISSNRNFRSVLTISRLSGLCSPGSSVSQRCFVVEQGHTDNLTGQLSHIFTISSTADQRVSSGRQPRTR